ncbi:ABC transporter ATP-binding protein [Paracoccus sp. SCSIO 75233]|uniref:ABC transporter ATP-binding protein n=1 Tax=Paracoccus sp. SCSIO 75233 TaxID=3017782 RepID=UPI0022F06404|nr:ABC transporter ATP-binding protein [Paracoccus sp. SCSIO 75233]WBU53745.1 ABC transporter ATP-binding protein [Paracoccus sp. SCSIO 75233]
MTEVLCVEGVSRSFRRRRFLAPPDVTHAVRPVDLRLEAGECLAIVGESGCGKSTLGRLALGLLTPDSGRVTCLGHNLAELTQTELRRLRARMALVHQNPLGALDPRRRVGEQIAEPLLIHRHLDPGSEVGRSAMMGEAMRAVSLDPTLANRFPHRLSGGQRQRVVIARALITRPELMVLDEPVSALDVSVQAQILSLLQKIKAETGVGFVFISHDLRVVRQLADRVAVMYRGRIVEEGPAELVLDRPRHPYTQLLRQAVPRLTPGQPMQVESKPSDAPPETGCAFAPRCALAQDACRSAVPALSGRDDGRNVACFAPDFAEVAA